MSLGANTPPNTCSTGAAPRIPVSVGGGSAITQGWLRMLVDCCQTLLLRGDSVPQDFSKGVSVGFRGNRSRLQRVQDAH